MGLKYSFKKGFVNFNTYHSLCSSIKNTNTFFYKLINKLNTIEDEEELINLTLLTRAHRRGIEIIEQDEAQGAGRGRGRR